MNRHLIAPLLCLSALLTSCVHGGRTGWWDTERRTVAHPVDGAFERVELRGAVLDVELRVEPVDAPSVVSHQEYSEGREPSVRVEVVDGTLVCEVEPGPGNGVSYADFELVLPPGPIALEVVTGAGDVEVRGLRGHARVESTAGDVLLADVDLEEGYVRTGAGDVEVSGAVARLSVSTSAGEVELRGLVTDELRVGTGAGDVEARLVQRPTRVEITTSAGDVRLTVPRGTYAVDAETSVGDLRLVGVFSDGGASSRLVVRSGAGDVRLRGVD